MQKRSGRGTSGADRLKIVRIEPLVPYGRPVYRKKFFTPGHRGSAGVESDRNSGRRRPSVEAGISGRLPGQAVGLVCNRTA
jgi:hypothetical protein